MARGPNSLVLMRTSGWVVGALFSVVAVGSGCSKRLPLADADAAAVAVEAVSLTQDEAMAHANEVCAALTKAGVATGCEPALRGHCLDGSAGCATSTQARFYPVGGFPGDRWSVKVSFTEKDFHGNDALLDASAPDDFPSRTFTDPKHLTSIGTVFGDEGPWDKCLGDGKQSVAVCAKQFPAQYAHYKALAEAAQHVFDGVPYTSSLPVPTAHTAAVVQPSHDAGTTPPAHPSAHLEPPSVCGGGCQCGDGSCGCCGRGCCSHHGGIR